MQNVYDYIFKNIEISIREIGYGDASINKKMKNYINLFYSIIEKIDSWDDFDFDKYYIFLRNNTFNSFLKGVIKAKF